MSNVKTQSSNQPIRLPGLKPGVCSGLILSGAFYPDLKIGVWRRRTYQCQKPNFKDFIFLTFELWHLEFFFKILSPQSFFELLFHHGDNGKEITDDAIGGNFKDGGLRVLIDGDDDI
jgi:hypothetical protein